MQYLAVGAATSGAVSIYTRWAATVVTVGSAGLAAEVGFALGAISVASGLQSVVLTTAAAYLDRHCQELEDDATPPHPSWGAQDPTIGTSGDRVYHPGELRTCRLVSVQVGNDPASVGWKCIAPPIVIDLFGDGFSWRGLDNPIVGDMEHDSPGLERSAWVQASEGVLFYDANGDGTGSHGESMLTNWVPGAKTDLEALRMFDTNRDGYFNAADASFAAFRVGRDFK